MENLDVVIEKRTPIEIELEVDKEGFTTAKKLYKWLELDETHYARWINSNILENLFAENGVDYSPIKASEKQGRGNFATDYKLSASFAKKLAMSTHSERGEQARIYFLMCEKALVRVAKEHQKFLLERAKSIAMRRTLTDVILESGENERMKGHGYSVYTDLVYKTVFGMNSKQLREKLGIDKKDNIRDYLSAEDLIKVSKMEKLASSLLDIGFDYGQVKDFITERLALSA
ncbi:MAG: antA/AntB antirepressor family protein [Synergistaceae bacterium]|nr:antA/AntB antirepressor family protein [Synergistaceae bacterium]MBR2207523.1 antA/AntB antirepressor family protein [Synergistaceae bacterium]